VSQGGEGIYRICRLHIINNIVTTLEGQVPCFPSARRSDGREARKPSQQSSLWMRPGAPERSLIRLNTRPQALSHRHRRGVRGGVFIGPRRCGHVARRL
jgi:hypothetical protein